MTFTPIAPTLPHALPSADGPNGLDEDDHDHIVCCHDDAQDVAFCGLDVSDRPLTTDSTDLCADCVALESTNFCPMFLTCTEM
jgi:hypothetical protein